MPGPQNKYGKYPCPCCGYYTLERPADNTFDICDVCRWEDDGVQLDDPRYEGGANHMSLEQARANYRLYGAKDEGLEGYVRPPQWDEFPDFTSANLKE